MTAAAGVTIITVTYNSAKVVEPMLASIPRGTSVVLVDNASDDVADLAVLASRFDARLIRNPKNLGFGAACNLGAAMAGSDLLLFLNPDTRVDPGALDLLIKAALRHPKASAFNPALIDDDGRVRFKRHSDLLPNETMPRGLPKADAEATVLVGAALLVRRAMFDAVAGFDERIFLYYEDDDLSLRLRRTCGPLMIIPAAVVRHARGASSGSDAQVSTFKAWHLGHAKVYALRKHHVAFARLRSVATALRKLTNPAVLFRPGEARGRFAYLRGVVSGLGKPVDPRKDAR